MFDTTLKDTLEQTLSLQFNKDVRIYNFKSVAGGCINYSVCVDTTIGHFFVKINDAEIYPDMFDKEVLGLKLLRSVDAISIPETINHGISGKHTFLVLECIQPLSKNDDFWEQFGVSLATLHRHTGIKFGLDHDNYIGSLKQINNQYDDWITFFH